MGDSGRTLHFMPSDLRTYIAECFKQAPLSWRKGAVIMTALVSAGLVAALFLGWHLDAYPAWVFITGTAIIAAGDVLVFFPYQLWKANRAEISALKDQISAKASLGEITDLYDETIRLLHDMERDHNCGKGVEHWEAKYKSLEEAIHAKIEAFAGKPEADIYARRGLIDHTKQTFGMLPAHQLYIDSARHDIMHLREFIKAYSRRGK